MCAVVTGEIIAFLGGVIFVFLDAAGGGLAITLGFLAVTAGTIRAIVQLLSKPVSVVESQPRGAASCTCVRR
jgi:hypothetical protein